MHMKKKVKSYLSPYFNCSFNGAISLFMAILMTPFLTIAMVLVDAGRYNNAVSILDEAMGISSTSTLAEMDSYLHKRWGIFGVDQEKSIDEIYNTYLSENAGILGESIQVSDISAKGMYSLAENEVLYNQILEYCKLNAPTELAISFGNISDILGQLDQVKVIKAFMNTLASGSEAVNATITLMESSDELKTLASELENQIRKYDEDYTAFENAVSALIDALNEPEPEKADYTDDEGNVDTAAYEKAKAAWQKAIDDARAVANGARDTYAGTISKLRDDMTAYREKMGTCMSALGNIGTKLTSAAVSAVDFENKCSSNKKTLEALQNDIKNVENGDEFDPTDSTYLQMKDWEQALSKDVAENEISYQILKAEKDSLSTVKDGYEKSFSKYDDATFGMCIQELASLQTTVEEFQADSYTENSGMISGDTYHNVSIASYVSAEEVDTYMTEQKQQMLGDSLKALLDGLSTFYNSIFKTSIFFDPELSTTLDVNYYNENLEGLAGKDSYDGSAMSVLKDIGEIMKRVQNFSKNLKSFDFISALRNLAGLIKSIIQFCKDVIQFVANIINNIRELFTSYERLYYTTYTTFNLPCRTDNTASGLSFSGMTGYTLGRDSLPDQGVTSLPGSFDGLLQAIESLQQYSKGIGDDLTFSGAELEYILYGSESEVANQMYTFFSLYLLRLILDIGPVAANAEVQSLAAASTLGYPAVMLLIMLAEPLADTVVLANGGAVNFIKSSVYLTPSGLPGLMGELVSIARFNADQKEEIKSGLVNAFGATDDDYDYQKTLHDYEERKAQESNNDKKHGASKYTKGLQNFNYREYCFFLMLVTVTKEQQFARLKNLIQMETLYHYKKEGREAIFDLKKSYTYLDTEVTVDVKQMMPSLIDSSLFHVTRQQFRGY